MAVAVVVWADVGCWRHGASAARYACRQRAAAPDERPPSPSPPSILLSSPSAGDHPAAGLHDVPGLLARPRLQLVCVQHADLRRCVRPSRCGCRALRAGQAVGLLLLVAGRLLPPAMQRASHASSPPSPASCPARCLPLPRQPAAVPGGCVRRRLGRPALPARRHGHGGQRGCRVRHRVIRQGLQHGGAQEQARRVHLHRRHAPLDRQLDRLPRVGHVHRHQ